MYPYSDEHYTPPEIPSSLGQFDLDPCAGPMSHASENFRLPDRDGLALPWHGRVWLNPPYSDLRPWLEKFLAHGNGVALLHAHTGTRCFQSLAKRADAMRFLSGRIYFLRPGGKRNRALFPSVLVALGGHNAQALARCPLTGFYAGVENR